MQIDDLRDSSFQFDVPVWTIIDAARTPRGPFVLAHEAYGPTLLIFTDEDAARTVIERTAPVGHESYPLESWPILRFLVETLKLQGARHVGIDLLADLSGRFVRINDFLAAIGHAERDGRSQHV